MRTFKLTLTVVGVAAIFLLIYLCRYVLFCLFTGIVLATALRTHIARVKRLGLSHVTAAAVVFTASLLVIGGIVAIVLPTLVGQVSRLWAETPALYATVYERLNAAESPALHRLVEMLPPTLALGTDDARAVRDVVATTAGFLPGSTLSRGALGAIAVLLFAFYWTLFEDRTLRSALLWVPNRTRSSVRDFIEAAQIKVGAFVRGQAWLCLIIGVLHLLVYWVLGLPYAIALGLISGMSEALPLIGPVVGAIPAILVASTLGFDKALWVVIASGVIQQLENHLLLPRIMSRSVGVNSLVTILAIAAFGVLFGVMGMILAIPLAAVLQLLLDRLLLLRESKYADASYGRDRVSRLRLQAAELAKDARTTFCRTGVADASNDADAPRPIEERIETIANDLSIALAVEGENAHATAAALHAEEVQPNSIAMIPTAAPLLPDLTLREFALRCIVVGLTLAGIALIWPLRGVLLLFALSLAVAAAVRPLAEWFRRKHCPASAAVALSFLIAVAVVTIPLGLLIGPLSAEIHRFSDEAVTAYDLVATRPTHVAADDVDSANVAALLRDSLRSDSDSDSSVTKTLFGMTFSLLSLAIEAGVVLVLSIYWTLDREYLERLWLSLLKPERRAKVRDLVRTVEYEVGAYFRSEFLQSLAAVVLLLLGYLTLGFPYPLLAAVCGGLAWVLPWVGAFFTVAVISLLGLPVWAMQSSGHYLALVIPACVYAVTVLWGLEVAVEPRLFGRRRYNMLLIAIVTLALTEIMGISGLLLGPPLALTLEIAFGFGLRVNRVAPAPAATSNEAEPITSLTTQAAAVRSELSQLDTPPQELLGLSERLNDLVDQVHSVADPATHSTT